MDESLITTRLTQERTGRWPRLAWLAAILLALVAAFVAYQLWATRAPAGAGPISPVELEERYGLRVRLMGVTAGGGMIDFRLKITDPEKARAFLEDPAHRPRLAVAESGHNLPGTGELGDDITWEEGGILFILFSNLGGVIQPGTPVVVSFGDLQLEPVLAQ